MFIGLQGYAVSDELAALARQIRPAGFVLFARNVAEPGQVSELTRQLAELAASDRPVLVAVDQEGGRVQRVREPATRWPAMRLVGRASGAKDTLVAEVATAMAKELRAMGFHLNFAPVADVDSNPKNPIIGDRSFGATSKDVARHVATFVRAHQAAGIIACAKHFPGHGDTKTDSHLELPVVEREEGDLRDVELPPFRAAVEAGVGTVMTAHVVYPAWDEDHPATMSPRIQHRILRKELGFSGVLFSDDLEMKAVRGRYTTEQQVRRMTDATVDVLLCCDRADLQVEVFEELVRDQERDKTCEQAAKDAVARVDALRERFLKGLPARPPLSVVGSEAHRDLAHRVLAEAG
jgi:beta-N-acetylhexosaminidase